MRNATWLSFKMVRCIIKVRIQLKAVYRVIYCNWIYCILIFKLYLNAIVNTLNHYSKRELQYGNSLSFYLLMVWRLSYTSFCGRHTHRTTIAVHIVSRPPYNHQSCIIFLSSRPFCQSFSVYELKQYDVIHFSLSSFLLPFSFYIFN